MEIKLKIGNEISALELEEYLRGVVPSEMSTSWSIEALKAQAIASRTYAVRRSGQVLTDTAAHQVYNVNKIHKNSDKAVEETRGLILIYNGKPIDAVYSASNGGRVRSALEQWGNDVTYLQAYDDPYDTFQRNGHGVGMSQRGAHAMAQLGMTYEEILAFYYPGAMLSVVEGTTMATNKYAKFTNEHFAEFCKSMIGQPYWYGTVVYNCTEDLRKRKAQQYLSHYNDNRTAQYRRDITAKKVCADCIGGSKGYAWTNGGEGVLEAIGTGKKITSKYQSNNCPDKGANSMFAYAKSKKLDWGDISTLPEVVGLALHKDGHVGYYIGNGEAVEWRGFNHGCVKTKVKDRGWKYWYELPFINYGDSNISTSTTSGDLGSRLLVKGTKGADVKALQEALIDLGYDLSRHGADGDFGTETETALKAFQKAEGLTVDGKYGSKTHAALMDALADSEPDVDETPVATGRRVKIASSGNVNIRVGNDTTYARITTVAPGATFEYVATASNGWHALVVNGQVGWVSGKLCNII